MYPRTHNYTQFLKVIYWNNKGALSTLHSIWSSPVQNSLWALLRNHNNEDNMVEEEKSAMTLITQAHTLINIIDRFCHFKWNNI